MNSRFAHTNAPRALPLVLVVFSLLVLWSAPATAQDTLHIVVTLEEEFEIPEHAVLEVHLRETFDPDQPTAQMATVRMPNPGSPPYIFELPYTPKVINQRYAYGVKAWITIDGDVWYNSIRSYPVLTQGAGTDVEVPLIRVGPPAEHALRGLPATFIGTVPCPDCAGVEYHLDLLKEKQVFFLRRTHERGAGRSADTIGMWGTTMDHTSWVLWQDTAEPLATFRYVHNATLRMLDAEGNELEPPGSHDLRRSRFNPIEPQLEMSGMFGFTAGTPYLTECRTGQNHLVTTGGDEEALTAAYMETQPEPGRKLLVTVDGRLVEGAATVRQLAVDRFLGVWPGETCGSRGTVSELFDTYWKLTRLGERPVPVADGQHEPHIVLHSNGDKVSGSGRCNSFSGNFEIDGESITFGHMASTMKACPGGDIELALLAALERAVTFEKTTHHLELHDGEGEMVARFEARYME